MYSFYSIIAIVGFNTKWEMDPSNCYGTTKEEKKYDQSFYLPLAKKLFHDFGYLLPRHGIYLRGKFLTIRNPADNISLLTRIFTQEYVEVLCLGGHEKGTGAKSVTAQAPQTVQKDDPLFQPVKTEICKSYYRIPPKFVSCYHDFLFFLLLCQDGFSPLILMQG